ncbi:Uncharacterised protein [Yersinia frederiksenii]|nr:Uncharacterised protein [Yersinia frederiksenii]CNG36617.1 Uncharacterised protein [Yersinia frederiksenii]
MSDAISHLTLEMLALKKIVSALYSTLSPADKEKLDVMLMDNNFPSEESCKSPSLQREVQERIHKILS